MPSNGCVPLPPKTQDSISLLWSLRSVKSARFRFGRIGPHGFTHGGKQKKGRRGRGKDHHSNVPGSGNGGSVHVQAVDSEHRRLGIGVLSVFFGVFEGLLRRRVEFGYIVEKVQNTRG